MAGTDFSHLTNDELINGIQALNLPDYIRSKAYGIDVRETLAQMTEMTIQLGVNMGLSPDDALKWARKLQESVSQSEFDSWVATLLDGGPSIFMNTLIELQSTYPNGASGVALVRETDPAKIYVWNGSAWEDFGNYQGIEVKDGTVTNSKIAYEAVTHDKTDFLKTGKNLFDKSKAILGYVSGTGDILTSPDTYVVSIQVSPNTTYSRTSYVLQVGFYNNDTFISHIGYNEATDHTLTTPANCNVMKVTVPDKLLENYQVEEGAVRTDYEPFGYGIARKFPNNVGRTDLKNMSVSEDKLIDKQGRLIYGTDDNLIKVNFPNQTISIPAQAFLISSTGILPVPKETIDISGYTSNTYHLFVNKATKNYHVAQASTPITDKDDFILLSFYSPGNSVQSGNGYIVVTDTGKVISNVSGNDRPFMGQKIVFYGDSITNRPNMLSSIANELGFESFLNMGWSDSAVTMEDKLAWVNPTTGVFMGNPAAGGQQPTGSVAVQSSFCHDDRIAYVPTDADVIAVMGFTNDLIRNKPIGTIGDGEETGVGAMMSTIKKLQNKVPDALIVLMTPIINLSAIGAETLRVNTLGNDITDYVKAMEEVADHTGAVLIDVHNCGINLFNGKNLLPDGTHPNNNGETMIARKFVGGLKAISPI